jgi:DNA primase small subunit
VNARTKAFLESKFREYYHNAVTELPPRFRKREWAFVLFDSAYPKLVMRRHKAFGSQKELYAYLGAVSPAHVYYSTACYAHPSATRMQDKKWEGADLIFDLDADKLFTDSVPQYALMLTAVKNETDKLLDFLMNDFSFEDADFSIVFSGGRGYHVHLREARLLTLGSHERREVVNYLTGTGLEPEYLIKRTNMVPVPDDNSCWEIRIRSWIERYFKRLSEMDSETATTELANVKAIGKRRAKMIVDEMSQDSTVAPLLQSKLMPLAAWKSLIREAILQIKVNIDVPVTADTKRLIRLPTSLHGGSGLRVTPLTLDEFRRFDPLRDAVVFSDRLISVKILRPTTAELKGETIKVQQGTTELPEHTAVYLMARGLAEYESRRFKSDQK